MVEIAIAIGVIGFALVAIIGILPTGLQVQRDNRTETIINQDGTYWMQALRNGAAGMDDLTNFVDRIEVYDILNPTAPPQVHANFRSGDDVIGLLTLQAVVTNLEARAFVWAISGSAAEKNPDRGFREMSFKYRMTVQIDVGTNFAFPFVTLATNHANLANQLIPNWVPSPVPPAIVPPLDTLYSVRLSFSFPLTGTDENKVTPRRQSYRSLVSRQVDTNNLPYVYFYE
jgi:hypothetical protein